MGILSKKEMTFPSLREAGDQMKYLLGDTKPEILQPISKSNTLGSSDTDDDSVYKELLNKVTAPTTPSDSIQVSSSKDAGTTDYVSQALQLLSAPSKASYTPGTYVSPYADKLDALINDILGSSYTGYDPAKDSTFSQYKKTYLREADRTQQDVLGQYAALTGGTPSSAAITAASQAGNQMRGELADILPQLAEQDYENYLSGVDEKRGKLSDLLALENDAYGKFADDENRRLTAWEAENDQQNATISKLLQAVELQDSREDRETAKANSAYERAMTLLAAGVMPDSDALKAAGLSEENASQLLQKYLASSEASSTSGDIDVNYETALDHLKDLGITDTSGLMDEEQFEAWNKKFRNYDSYEDYLFDYIYQREN